MRFMRILVFLLCVNSVAFANEKPNIVFLFVDDLGWVDVSTGNTNQGRGSTIYDTPNIDRLAAEGMSFTHAYTQQNCSPTRASLITGKYATDPDNNVYNVVSLARQDASTQLPILITPPEQSKNIAATGVSIFDMAKSVNYTTCFIGKDHGTGINDLGIDIGVSQPSPFSLKVNGNNVQSYYFALDSDDKGWSFDSDALDAYASPYSSEYVNGNLQAVANGNDLSFLAGKPKHMTDAMGDYCVDYIERKYQAQKPFFLYVPFHAVHSKVAGRQDLKEKYLNKGYNDDLAEYAAIVETTDQTIGRIYKAIKDPNGDGDFSDDISENTILIVYSDNGGLKSNRPLTGGKGTFTEGGIRVPLIIKYPNVIEANSITNQSVHAIDFFPTLAEMIGVDVSNLKKDNNAAIELDGVSFASILKGEESRLDRENIFWHFPGYMGSRQRPNSMIQKRIGDDYYKLRYYYETGVSTLHHINSDISETVDLLEKQDANHMQLAEIMLSELKQWLRNEKAPTGTWADGGGTVPFPDTVKCNEAPLQEFNDTIRFTTTEDFMAFVPFTTSYESISTANDLLQLKTLNNYPRITVKPDIDYALYDKCRIVLKNTSSSTKFNLKWKVNTIEQSKTLSNITANDSEFKSYVIDLGSNANWKGDISDVSLWGPNRAIASTLIIDTLEFYSSSFTTQSLSIEINGEGQVNYDSGEYRQGQNLNLWATPDNGYTFTGWTGDTVSSENPLDMALNTDVSLTANFEPLPSYPLNITSQNGTVTKSQEGNTYPKGSFIKLTANPDDGYQFSGWSGDIKSSSTELSIRMDSVISLSAVFTSVTSVNENLALGFTVSPNPSKNGIFTLSEISDWTVHNLSGVKVVEGKGSQINLSSFGRGVYLLKTKRGVARLLY